MHVKNRLKFLALGLVLGIGIFAGVSGKAAAAGSAQFTVESEGSVTAGQNVTLRFYVTPSGGPGLFVASVRVNLTNLTYVSGTSSGYGFSGTGSAQGGTAGATTFDVVASHQSGSSSTGKTLMYTVTVQAAGSAGTGTVALSNAQADDTTVVNLDPGAAMSTSTQNRSITINAAQVPTCPSGQTGTPPNCTTPSGGGGSGSGSGSTPNPNNNGSNPNPNTNTTDNPNPGSDVGLGTDENGAPVAISENDLSLLASGIDSPDNASEEVATITETSVFKRSVTIALIAALVVAAIIGGKIIIGKIMTARALGSHASGSVSSSLADDADTDSDNDTKLPPSNSGSGPTIIHPQQ